MSRARPFAPAPDTLAQSIVILLGVTIAQRFVGFGRSILFCRWLPADQLGHWDLTLAFLDLAAPIAVLSLPACFGRYVEHYRQRGQLRIFLRRTVVAVLALASVSVLCLDLNGSWFAHLLYGEGDSLRLMSLVALVLPFLIVYNTFVEVLAGLRLYRVISGLQFLQSLAFAGLGVTLVLAWRPGAQSVIIGYGAACAVCCVAPLPWLLGTWRTLPGDADPLPRRQFWGKLLPFVFSVWISNWVGNLFGMVDRYMIVHFSRMDAADALTTVGQYHSARVVPLLLVSVATLLSSVLVPFLSHDWEAGRRSAVGARINLFLKVAGLGLTAVAALVLAASPILFDWVFAGKFQGGLSVLPFTLMCSVWFGMFSIAKTYLWCDERVGLVSFSMLAGIAVNVAACLFLLPRWGLPGAAVSACAANGATLVAVYGLARRRGMVVSPGTWLVSAVPAVLCLGPWIALAALVALAVFAATNELIFDRDEKAQFASAARDYLTELRARWDRRRVATGAVDR